MNDRKEIQIYAGLVCLTVLLLGMGWWWNDTVSQRTICQYKALAGSLYQQDEEMAEAVLQQLFQAELSQGNIQQGEEAATALGYEEDGYEKVYDNLVGKQMYVIFVLLFACLFTGMFFLLTGQHNIEKRYLEDLLRRMEEAKELCQPMERAGTGSSQRMRLEKGIADLLLTSEQQKKYFELRQEQMRQFIENVAHQLKTPLSCMVLNMDLLEHKIEQQTSQEKTEDKSRSAICLLEENMQQAEKMQKLLLQLLNIARMEAGKVHFQKESIALYELLCELCSLYPEGNYQITGISPENDVPIRGDREWLLEALENILVNAIRHGGNQSQSGTPIQIQVTVLAESVKIRIADQGQGMNTEQMEHLFDRFYTGQKGGNDSTGIGLNLSKLVIEGNYGSISAQSSTGNGTVIEIRLPLWQMKEKM